MRRRIRSAFVPVRRHALPQLVIDAVLVAVAYFVAYRLRFGFFSEPLPKQYHLMLDRTIVPVVLLSLLSFIVFRVYLRSARFASIRDLVAIVYGSVMATVLAYGYVAVVRPVSHLPVGMKPPARALALYQTFPTIPTSVIAFFFLLLLGLMTGSRLVARLFHERRMFGAGHRAGARTVLIIGAGDGGRLVLREIARNPNLGLRPVGFVDDDPAKDGLRIDGVRVLGSTEELARIVDLVHTETERGS